MGEGNQILVEVTKLQVQMETVSEQLKEINKIGSTLAEIAQSVKSAHNRLDDFKTDYDKKLDVQKEDFDKKLAAETKAREECIAAEAKARDEDIKDLDKSFEKDLRNHRDNFKEFASDIKFLKRSVYGGFISLIGSIVFFAFQWLANN